MVEFFECLNDGTTAFLTLLGGIYILASLGLTFYVFDKSSDFEGFKKEKYTLLFVPGAIVLWGGLAYWIVSSIINIISCLL